ncbi:hypothetical protein BD289DRAFT_367464 [Coniella lustricola]|uniref:F-box domain-containing protein n=1 Tax=Coniella lustricola TaxID=2025994 RepID=A0A2T3A9F3_9PEZI|nr:hypothetical protein BD289DRAFT_367464 [Coniella lustricola]
MAASQDVNPELESFREQWRAEVRARNTATSGQQQPRGSAASARAESSKDAASGPPRPTHLGTGKPKVVDTEDDYYDPESRVFDEPAPVQAKRADHKEAKEPVTALEHYERAVEKEGLGSLGDSLSLYRKAFRMDHKVDQKYKNKHFAAAWAKPAHPIKPPVATQEPPATVPLADKSLTTESLIATFAGLKIEPAKPPIQGMPEPPCPIASLPEEILVHILQDVATSDVADFVRLSRVCKRFAWLVGTEDRIWRHICLKSIFGFNCMHYDFQVQPNWRAIEDPNGRILGGGDGSINGDEEADGKHTPDELVQRRQEEAYATTVALHNTIYNSSWQKMFQRRPRIRFNGCYISTVNYIRPGQQVNSITWNTPVHIVTYYRYLRLFRDGTAISLCTVEEPSAVVHHLSKDNMTLHKGGAMNHLPSSVMHLALPARWKLSSIADYEDKANEGEEKKQVSLADSEGDLFIETDGGGNYVYRFDLSLRSAGRASRNNKLLWRGFYSLNKDSGDWDEFTLRNDNNKPWFFSRVRTYGFGDA